MSKLNQYLDNMNYTYNSNFKVVGIIEPFDVCILRKGKILLIDYHTESRYSIPLSNPDRPNKLKFIDDLKVKYCNEHNIEFLQINNQYDLSSILQ
jgi:hypothetical protein